jgi:hypothetical protein
MFARHETTEENPESKAADQVNMQTFLAAFLGALLSVPSVAATTAVSPTQRAPHVFRYRAVGTASPRTASSRRRAGEGLYPFGHNVQTRGANAPHGITMQLDAGWSGRYRAGPAWTPVRVTIRNLTGEAITGTLELPDSSVADAVQSGQMRAALYSQIVTLPSGATKRVTLYIPGADINNELGLVFRVGHRTLSSSSVFPTSYGNQDITVGALTKDPAAISWLNRLTSASARVHVVPLGPSSVDPLPEVLASFDLIVVTNVDVSRLDREQLAALDRYVRNGGSLLLVGGPDATETLRPLNSWLLPGHLAGSLPLPNLAGLRPLGRGLPPPRPTTVSVLKDIRGAILATEKGIPLVVRTGLGNGSLEYLAFDPALEPIVSWTSAPALLDRLVAGAAPESTRRMSLPPGYDEVSFLKPGNGPLDLTREAVSLPVASTVALVLLAVLTLLYVLLAGPVGFLALRRLRRPGLTWLVVPMLVLAFTGVASVIGALSRSDDTLVNSLGMLQLDGTGTHYPLNLYLGLTAPAHGTYRLMYDAPGLAAPIIPFSLPQPQVQNSDKAVAWNFQQGMPASIAFTSSGDWRTRAASVRTSVSVPGSVRAHLILDRSGNIVGTIQNDTGLTLANPAIIAGRAWQRLPSMGPHQSVRVSLRPSTDIHRHDYSEMLFKVYGLSSVFDTGSDLWRHATLSDRIRDAVSALPQTHVLSMVGEVMFVAWTEQPLLAAQLNGAVTEQRSLTLAVKPLTVELAPGTIRLRNGTLGASLVDESPAQPKYSCCNPSAQAIYIGTGGSATFEFDIPRARPVHFRNLTLSVYGGGPDATYTGYTDMPAGACRVFDWRRLRWQSLNFRDGEAVLRQPNRFVSATGALLVKLAALDDSHELIITDPHQDLQLSGTLVVG